MGSASKVDLLCQHTAPIEVYSAVDCVFFSLPKLDEVVRDAAPVVPSLPQLFRD